MTYATERETSEGKVFTVTSGDWDTVVGGTDPLHDERIVVNMGPQHPSTHGVLRLILELEGETIGAIYLDHRYHPACFREEDVLFLGAFAAQAALAIQKANLIAELRAAKEKLEKKVESQAQRIDDLSGELAQVRDQLKLFDLDRVVCDEHVGNASGNICQQRLVAEQSGRRDDQLWRGKLPHRDVLRAAAVGPDVAGVERQGAVFTTIKRAARPAMAAQTLVADAGSESGCP